MPVIWLIDAYRAGERGQVRALVEALGWPCETKVLDYRRHVFLPHVLGQSTLRGIRAESAAQLSPPWPDLVISCGVRNEPVCRWICEQSGGRTRYVHVGRPWAVLDSFDLVITTPQYRVPPRSNVLNNTLTIRGEKSRPETIGENDRPVRGERRFGSFNRSLDLPADIDADGLTAKCHAGVLDVRIPKLESSKPKSVKIDIDEG